MITGSKDSATFYVEPCTNTKFKGKKIKRKQDFINFSQTTHIIMMDNHI